MTVGERGMEALAWVAERTPRQLLLCGWLVFMLGSYPGYLSIDSILQLYTVRSGEYSDYAPMMTGLWGALEYISAGPFPMLAVQSGLFLVGLYGVLKHVLSPRAAAVTAACVVLFPPVFSLLAVIWPEPMMASALVAATGAALVGRRGWTIASIGITAFAIGCRFEAIFAAIPLAVLVIPGRPVRRFALAIAVALAVFIPVKIADSLLTVSETYTWQQRLMLMDTVGTLRRAKVKDPATLTRALAGLSVGDPATVKERVTASSDALDWYPVAHGAKRIVDPITDEDQAAALRRNWRSAIGSYAPAYLRHRWTLFRGLLGLGGKWAPVYDEFGDVDLLVPLHHRATQSDWQYGMQRIVRAVARTPLFKPWMYLALAIAGLWFARGQRILRACLVSGLVFQIAMFFLAPAAEYRYSHWLITTTCIALAGLIVARRYPAEPPDV